MPDQPKALLVVESGIRDMSVIPLDKQAQCLGKPPIADIPIDNPYVSRRHAQIDFEEGRFQIRDLGSKNGTFVNGSRLAGQGRLLHSGDRIELGQGQVVLRFQEWSSTVTLPSIGQDYTNELVVDVKSREVWVQGVKVEPPLSRKEFDVLDLLCQRRGEACSKDEIAARGWPERGGVDVGDQEIEQCIRRVRLRIELDPSQPRYIFTVRGYGYKLSQD